MLLPAATIIVGRHCLSHDWLKQTIENYTTLQLHRGERMVEIRELRDGTLKSLYSASNNPPVLVPGYAPFKMQPGKSGAFLRWASF